MRINYQKQLEDLIEKNLSQNIKPKLMLHACCACCSSYVLEYLTEYFSINIVYYNPNITSFDEYSYRYSELKRLVSEMPLRSDVNIVEPTYNPDVFISSVKGFENTPEGGARCSICFKMRLAYTAKLAKQMNCDYFATTLTISPLKNAEIINNIGTDLQETVGVKYLATDFKKKNGYKRSIELSRKYNLYRQNYCGCVYSKKLVDKS